MRWNNATASFELRQEDEREADDGRSSGVAGTSSARTLRQS